MDFPTEGTREEIEAWRATNPWPWREELRRYTLANSTQECRDFQMQWEPIPYHLRSINQQKGKLHE